MSEIKMDEEMRRSKTADLDETQPEGFAGRSTGLTVNLTEEEAYWKEKYKTQAYYNEGREYEDYATAFHYGWKSASKPENAGRKFEEIESELEREWPSHRSSNEHSWQDFKDAVRDAYNRIQWPK